MNRTRHGVALVIVVGLAALTVAALQPPERVVLAMPATTTSTTVATTTTAPPSTTTTVIDREAQITEIVGDFYFAWFDGVYREDAEEIDRIAGSESVLEQGLRAFGRLAFTGPPSRDAVGVELRNVLLDRPDCLVVSAGIDVRTFIDTDEVMDAVDVFFRVGDRWGRAESFLYEQELWQVTCDHMQRR